MATSSWSAKRYLERIRDDPDWKAKSLKTTLRRELCLDVGKSKIYTLKQKALELLSGSYKEQYSRLWDYCNILVPVWNLDKPRNKVRIGITIPFDKSKSEIKAE